MIDAERLAALVDGLDGVAGILLHDLETGEEAGWNPDECFVAASLIKLPILWHFYLACSRGALDPDETVRLDTTHLVPGFGVLRSLEPGLTLRLRDLATLMIVVSDNTATNLLVDRLGIAPINATITALGLTQTVLQRKMYDYRDPNKNNFTSPRDMITLLRVFATNDQLAPTDQAALMQTLLGQQLRNKLPAGLPREAKLAHKTGDLPRIEHDAGIFFGSRRQLAVAVLTKELARPIDGVTLCRQVGELAYDAIQ
jgi:beta-lactamase class A